MNFDFSETQLMLRDSLRRYLDDAYGFEKRQAMLRSASGRDPAIWKALATELGVLGAALPEDAGGLGGGPVDTMVLMEEFGRALANEPFVPAIVIGAQALAATGGDTASALLPDVLSGKAIIAPGFYEPRGRHNPAAVETVAKAVDGGWQLSGHKAVVDAGPCASHYLVTARTAGSTFDREGISLFLIESGASGIVRRDYLTVDGYLAAELVFESVKLGKNALLGAEGAALDLVEKLIDHATVAVCAEATGAMQRLHEQTLDYARQRKQFGRPISDFQVIQHRLVDMLMEVEQARSMTLMATLRLDEPDRARWVSEAKAKINRAGRALGQAAIQTHGGIGITEELAAGHYFKRISMIESRYGDLDWHCQRLEDRLTG